MPSKKKKYNARFPAGRIKKIMQTDEEVGKVAQAVPVIISRTLELFVGSLLTKAMQITSAKNAKTLTPSHMKQCILSEQRFDFLKDLVKTVQDTSNGEEECITPGLILPGSNKMVPERRKSSSSFVKEETSVVNDEIKLESSNDALEVDEDCSPLHITPNYYTETNTEQRLGVHQQPIVSGNQPPRRKSSGSFVLEETTKVVKDKIKIGPNQDPLEVDGDCSALHLAPNYYTETNPEQRLSAHQQPDVPGYQPPPTHLHPPYQDQSQSPMLFMDEDYDT